ncbi:MAG TPA: hypothetical protein VLF67_04265 [Candidatus Saccharimonas sp.]|nr:hypothetical protein [Candidatus Saccharimonas sp.]
MAEATSATEVMLRMDRMQQSASGGGTLCYKTATVAVEDDVMITFPTGYSLATVVSGNWTVSTSNLPSDPAGGSATAWPNIGSATVTVSGQNVTFTFSSNLAVNTFYCFNFGDSTHAPVTNPGTPGDSQQGSVTTHTSAPAVIDFSKIALSVVASDSITVTAVVPPIFTFSMPLNTDAFTSDLDPASTKTTTGVVFTVGTNAKGGWVAWIKDVNTGLTSAAASHTIPSVAVNTSAQALTNGTEGYGINASVNTAATGSCTVTIDGPYNGTIAGSGATTGNVGTSYQQIAHCTGGTSTGGAVKVQEQAAISASTAASSDYTDTLTIVGAGDF